MIIKMSDSKFVLSKVKVGGETKDIVARSDGDYTTVNYKGEKMTLNSVLASVGNDTPSAVINTASDSEVRSIFKM